MKWFQGSIAEAVAASKTKKAVFVVFVEGKDDTSQEVAKALDSTEVSSKLSTEKFVAIKLQSDSENYTFFVQIYQLVPVPSIFFIGESGTPLEIVGNPMSPGDLAIKIDSILLKAYPQTTHSSVSFIQAEQKAHSSTNPSSNQEIVTNTSTTNLIQEVQNLSHNEEVTTVKASTSEEKAKLELSQEEKVRRARELIELQNRKKAEEEERKEREQEVQRRQTGKDVQKMKREQHDRELREAHAERMKEKAADAAAREKILKQIAEDKLERKKKYEIHLQEKTAQEQKKNEESLARAQAISTDMSKARIQFKLPTGTSITGTFEATSNLGSLRTYVVQNAELPFRQFAMSSFFPRKDFSIQDDSKTLIELELVPSAVILILPMKLSNPASVIKASEGGGNIFTHFFWSLLAPVMGIYNYVMGYFTGRPRGGESTSRNERQDNSGNASGGNPNISFGRFSNMGVNRRLGGTSKIRTRGNIRTLHSGDDDNDENNTWNGNSTQQM